MCVAKVNFEFHKKLGIVKPKTEFIEKYNASKSVNKSHWTNDYYRCKFINLADSSTWESEHRKFLWSRWNSWLLSSKWNIRINGKKRSWFFRGFEIDKENMYVGPFDRVAVDVLGPLLPSLKRNRYIVVFSEYQTRWVEAFAISNVGAKTTGNCSFKRLFVDTQLLAHYFVIKDVTSFRVWWRKLVQKTPQAKKCYQKHSLRKQCSK